MLKLISQIPQQLEHSWEKAGRIVERIPKKLPRFLAVCGMGGSGISGDLLRGLLLHTSPVPIEIIKDYVLPGWIDKRGFAVVISYSGNTEETLSLWKMLAHRKVPRMAITSGGEIKKLAQVSGVPVVAVPGGNPPRASVGYLFAPLLRLAKHWELYPRAADELKAVISLIDTSIPAWEEEANKIASSLYGRFPLIHVLDTRFYSLGYRLSCQLNENSKVLAHVHTYSEMNHNEIMGFEGGVDKDVTVIVLDPGDEYIHPRNRMRNEIVIKNLPSSLHTYNINAEGESLLERFFSLLVKGDLVSVFLAESRGVDPMPVKTIEKLKKELG